MAWNLKMTFCFWGPASFQELRLCYFWKRYLKGSNNQVFSRKHTFSRLHCRMKSQKVNSKSFCSLHVLAPLFFLAVKQWAIVGGFNPVDKEYEKNMGHLSQIGDDHTNICIYNRYTNILMEKSRCQSKYRKIHDLFLLRCISCVEQEKGRFVIFQSLVGTEVAVDSSHNVNGFLFAKSFRTVSSKL